MTDQFDQTVADLFARIKLGDRAAYRAFYEISKPKLYRLLFNILHNEDLALEALQELFIKLWRQADQHNPDKGRTWGWICQVARNLAIDSKRANQKFDQQDSLDVDTLADALAAQDPNQQLGKLDQCLNQLKLMQRQCITMAYQFGLTHSELSAHFDQPLGSIKSLVRRGLQELKTCLS